MIKTDYFYLYLCAIMASFGGFLSGYDTGVISGAILYISKSFELSANLSGILVSSVSLGAVFGAFINGLLVDKIGRKKVLIISALIFILASISCAIAPSILFLILSRALIGLAVGIVSFVGPLYLSEISTKEKRGAIVSFHQLAITFGILFSYLSNFYCARFDLNWRIMFFVGVFPALVLLFAMLFQKDTPRWLVLKGRIDEAKNLLKKIDCSKDADFEVDEIKKTIDIKTQFKFSKRLIMPFIIGIGIMMVQITTGINAIIYYAPVIFKMVGFNSNSDALFATIIIGFINFLMTFVAIAYSDKLGRKPLLYIGLSGMTISLLVLAFSFTCQYEFIKYLAVIATGTYIVSFSMSLGPIGLLLVSEVFPLNYRGFAMSISIVSNFIFNFIVTGLFPVSLSKLGGTYTFLIFVIICILSLLFVRFVVPETKGISLEEIEARWSK